MSGNASGKGAHEVHQQHQLQQVRVYEIRVQGHMSHLWTDWFEGFTVVFEENGEMLLTGPIPDQAALYGMLRKVRDMGLPLLSVNCIDSSNDS